jgi:hypothetical protein
MPKMGSLFETYLVSTDELRRLTLHAHGLDLSTTRLFYHPIIGEPSSRTELALNHLISDTLLRLAVSLRMYFYQGLIKGDEIEMDWLEAGIYFLKDMKVKQPSLKEVCDKIIHADSISKPVLIEELTPDETDHKASIHLQGKQRGKEWVMDICLEALAERILRILDDYEENKQLT